MTRKCHVRFGGGPMEKEWVNQNLASGLPYTDGGESWQKLRKEFGEIRTLAVMPH
jgi:hypothetical protein